jgi:hypothetical protein
MVDYFIVWRLRLEQPLSHRGISPTVLSAAGIDGVCYFRHQKMKIGMAYKQNGKSLVCCPNFNRETYRKNAFRKA